MWRSGPEREEPAATPAASTGAAAAAATKRRKRAEKAKKEPVCEACGTRGAEPVVACSRCRLPFHALCIRLEEEQAAGDADAEPLCPVCRGPDDGAECALCGAADGRATVRCSLKTCGRTFHGQCLQVRLFGTEPFLPVFFWFDQFNVVSRRVVADDALARRQRFGPRLGLDDMPVALLPHLRRRAAHGPPHAQETAALHQVPHRLPLE